MTAQEGDTVSGALHYDDPDIGLCDDCGTEKGKRFRTIIPGTWDGVPGRCVAWLCDSCKRRRAAASVPSGEGTET